MSNGNGILPVFGALSLMAIATSHHLPSAPDESPLLKIGGKIEDLIIPTEDPNNFFCPRPVVPDDPEDTLFWESKK